MYRDIQCGAGHERCGNERRGARARAPQTMAALAPHDYRTTTARGAGGDVRVANQDEQRPADQPESLEERARSRSRRTAVAWRRRPSLIFWLMFWINAINYLDRYIVVAVAPALKVQFHLLDRDVGVLSTSYILVYTLAALPMGLLADRVSRARVVGVGAWSGISAATAFVQNFAGLFVARSLVGIGEASYYPAGTALLTAYIPLRQRARVLGRWQTAQLVGIALAFAVTAAVYRVFGGDAWRPAFLVSGVPGLGLALLMWFMADTPRAGRRGQP